MSDTASHGQPLLASRSWTTLVGAALTAEACKGLGSSIGSNAARVDDASPADVPLEQHVPGHVHLEFAQRLRVLDVAPQSSS